jgi:hypothetical protein
MAIRICGTRIANLTSVINTTSTTRKDITMNNKDNKVVPIRPGVEIKRPTDTTVRSLGEAEVNLPPTTLRSYAGVEQMMQQTLEKQHFGILSHLNQRQRTEGPPKNDDFDPLAWQHLLNVEHLTDKPDRFRPTQTPPEKRNKIRNACVSGHFPGEEKKCPLCQRARFNTLVTGYYIDKPGLPQLRETIMRMIGEGRYDSEDYRFIMDYLGLPHNIDLDGLKKFYNKIHKIETMSRWANSARDGLFFIRHPLLGEMVPLASPYYAGSGLVASLIQIDEQLREIYKEAATINYETSWAALDPLGKLPDNKGMSASKVSLDIEADPLSGKGPAIVYHTIGGDAEHLYAAAKRNRPSVATGMDRTTVLIEPGNPFGAIIGGRQERRRLEMFHKLNTGYKLKRADGPKKRGVKNTDQLVKDIKPHPLLKHLIKKTEK